MQLVLTSAVRLFRLPSQCRPAEGITRGEVVHLISMLYQGEDGRVVADGVADLAGLRESRDHGSLTQI